MKRILLALAASAATMASAQAANVGVSMASFDDNFLTVLRSGIQSAASKKDGMTIQFEDATSDIGKQLNQVQNFIAQGVDGIIVNPVDTDATPQISKLASDAGIPLVYVNRQPADLESLPEKAAFVGSDETLSGTLQTQQVCKLLMTNWISAGVKPAAVISNNDEMAIGAIQALKAAGVNDVIVAGIDATQDGLAAMKAGDLKVTVFQNAAGQGSGAVDAMDKLIKGEKVEKNIDVPFELVTPDNMATYEAKN